MGKRVRITLEMDNSFVSQLRANCTMQHLGNLREDYKPHTAMQALGMVALLEAMGATEEQVNAETPMDWRNNIRAIHEDRKVLEDKS